MFNDVVDLRDFYASHLGRMARHLIRSQIRRLWPDLSRQSLLGLGYATPYLRPFLGEAARVVAMMPATQGVLHWPGEGPGVTLLGDEADIPLPDRSMDRILVVHALECTEHLRAMMREVWRVLADGGHILVVVPNRRGIWARLERTPFGHGHPYSPTQLSRLLRDTMFTPMETRYALHFPPSQRRWFLRAYPAWESLAARWFPAFSGIVMIEAVKQVYGGNLVTARSRRLRLIGPAPATAGGLAGARGHNGNRDARCPSDGMGRPGEI